MLKNNYTHNPRAIISSPWWIRKLFYILVAIGGLVAAAFGWVSPEQVDAWPQQVGPVVTFLVGLIAATQTNKYSDWAPDNTNDGEALHAEEPPAEQQPFSIFER